MKRFLPFFLILALTAAPALVLGWDPPESFNKDVEQPQAIPQSPNDEVPDDGDEEKEDDDYD